MLYDAKTQIFMFTLKKPTASAKNRTRSHFFGCQSLTFLLGVMINPFSEVHLSIGELAIFPSHRSQRNNISKSRRQRVKKEMKRKGKKKKKEGEMAPTGLEPGTPESVPPDTVNKK